MLVILPASTRNGASRCWLRRRGGRSGHRLVRDPEVADVAGDHLRARLGPGTSPQPVNAAQRQALSPTWIRISTFSSMARRRRAVPSLSYSRSFHRVDGTHRASVRRSGARSDGLSQGRHATLGRTERPSSWAARRRAGRCKSSQARPRRPRHHGSRQVAAPNGGGDAHEWSVDSPGVPRPGPAPGWRRANRRGGRARQRADLVPGVVQGRPDGSVIPASMTTCRSSPRCRTWRTGERWNGPGGGLPVQSQPGGRRSQGSSPLLPAIANRPDRGQLVSPEHPKPPPIEVRSLRCPDEGEQGRGAVDRIPPRRLPRVGADMDMRPRGTSPAASSITATASVSSVAVMPNFDAAAPTASPWCVSGLTSGFSRFNGAQAQLACELGGSVVGRINAPAAQHRLDLVADDRPSLQPRGERGSAGQVRSPTPSSVIRRSAPPASNSPFPRETTFASKPGQRSVATIPVTSLALSEGPQPGGRRGKRRRRRRFEIGDRDGRRSGGDAVSVGPRWTSRSASSDDGATTSIDQAERSRRR